MKNPKEVGDGTSPGWKALIVRDSVESTSKLTLENRLLRGKKVTLRLSARAVLDGILRVTTAMSMESGAMSGELITVKTYTLADRRRPP